MSSAEQSNNETTKPSSRSLSKKRRHSPFIANTAAIYDGDDDNDDSSSSLSSVSPISDDDSLRGGEHTPISSSASSMLPSGDNNLLQVQNFLNCFDETGKQHHQHSNDELINLTNNNHSDNLKNKININSHNNNHSVSNRSSPPKNMPRSSSISKDGSNFSNKSSPGRPQKFTISTKFLRKSRNKLRTASGSQCGQSMPSTVTGGMASTSSSVIGGSMSVPATSVCVSDDSNAKFKDFSIDSLLNK